VTFANIYFVDFLKDVSCPWNKDVENKYQQFV
jgi:hypothetical protein